MLGCNENVEEGDLLVSGNHHDSQKEGNPVGYYHPGAWPNKKKLQKAKTLILSFYIPPIEETCPDPLDDENDTEYDCISRYRLQDDAIYVVNGDGSVDFKWFAYEHFDEMGFLPEAREAIRETHRAGANNENASDYHHFNAVSWVGENKWWKKGKGDLRFNPEYIVWDARGSNITAIIATDDHPDGETWMEGDIVWKIGPNYRYPLDPESKLRQIIGQHMAHIIPKGLPGAGNMMIFDNGGGAGWGPLFAGAPLLYEPSDPLIRSNGRANPDRRALQNTQCNFSRVIEFNPITLERVWEYSQPKPTADNDEDGHYYGNERLFYSFYISGAQRLKNGNTLIAEGAMGRVFEVTPDNKVVWEFVNPFPSAGFGGIPATVGSIYRAYRVPYKWAPCGKRCPTEPHPE